MTELIQLCQEVVDAYDEGRIEDFFEHHRGKISPAAGICGLLENLTGEKEQDLFHLFLTQTGKDPAYPVGGFHEFCYPVILWWDTPGKKVQPEHAKRVDLLREFIEWLEN